MSHPSLTRGYEPYHFPYGGKAVEKLFRGTIRDSRFESVNFVSPYSLLAPARQFTNPKVKRPVEFRAPSNHTSLKFRMPDGYLHDIYIDPDVWAFSFQSEPIFDFFKSGPNARPMMVIRINSTMFRSPIVTRATLIYCQRQYDRPLYVNRVEISRRQQ